MLLLGLAMADRPLTTGEGTTTGREAEIGRTLRHAQATRSTRSDSWLNGYQEDVAWLLAECSRLREQLDAARQALADALDCKGPYNGTVSERGGYPALCHNCADRARAALGVEGPGAGQSDGKNPGCSFVLRGDFNDCAHAGGGRGAKDAWCESCVTLYASDRHCGNCGLPVGKWGEVPCFDGHEHRVAP